MECKLHNNFVGKRNKKGVVCLVVPLAATSQVQAVSYSEQQQQQQQHNTL